MLLLSVLILAAGVFYALHQLGPQAGFWPQCLFYRWTGFHCVGCGMTRATHAILNGQFLKAVGLNPLLVLVAPVFSVWLIAGLFRWIRGRPYPVWFHWNRWTISVAIGVVLIFWILRNVPFWPFLWLAP